jgi:hypothetical protein
MRTYNFPGIWSRAMGASRWNHPWVSTYRISAVRSQAIWGSSSWDNVYEEPQEFSCQVFFDCNEDLKRFLHDNQGKWQMSPTILQLAIPTYWEKNHDERRKWIRQLQRMGAHNIVPRGDTSRDIEGKPQVSYNVYFQNLEDAKTVSELYQTELYAKHWHVRCKYRMYKESKELWD